MMETLTGYLVAVGGRGAQFLLLWSWQALILLGVVWLSLRLYGSRPPAIRYRIWLCGLLAVALLPLCASVIQSVPLPQPTGRTLTYLVEVPQAVIVPWGGASAHAVGAAPEVGVSLVWPLLFVAWAGGVLLTLRRHVNAYRKLHQVRKRARPISAAVFAGAEVAWGRLTPEEVHLGLSPEVRAPVLIGWLRPMILLPADIGGWTTAGERVSMVQHELAHVQRRDHSVNFFQLLLGTVFFFHPLVRYACHQLSVERELACDEQVLSLGAEASAYAESLLKAAERHVLAGRVGQPAFFSSRNILERRVDMILNRQRLSGTSHSRVSVIPVVGLMGVMMWLLVPGRPAAAGDRQHRIALPRLPLRIGERIIPQLPPPPGARGSGDSPSLRSQEAEGVIEKVLQRQDISISFQNREGAPVMITEASAKVVTREEYHLLTGVPIDPQNDSEYYVTLPRATISNNTNQRITAVSFHLINKKSMQGPVIGWSRLKDEPYGTYTFKATPGEVNVGLSGVAGDIILRLLRVEFEDGSTWKNTPDELIGANLHQQMTKTANSEDTGTRARAGEAIEKIMQRPAIPIPFENREGAPVMITEATMRVATREEYHPLTGWAQTGLEDVKYMTLPGLTVVNNTNRHITKVVFRWRDPLETVTFYLTAHSIMIEPHGSYTFQATWRDNILISANARDVVASVARVEFKDGSEWGKL